MLPCTAGGVFYSPEHDLLCKLDVSQSPLLGTVVGFISHPLDPVRCALSRRTVPNHKFHFNPIAIRIHQVVRLSCKLSVRWQGRETDRRTDFDRLRDRLEDRAEWMKSAA